MDYYGSPYMMYGGSPYMHGTPGMNQNNAVHVDQVDGEQGAREVAIPPNSEKLVLDKSGEMIWLIKTDSYGMKSLVAPYDIKPHKTEQAVQYDAIDARLKRLEEILSEFTADSSATDKQGEQPLYAT